jgi:DNA-directed RNA polymerase subunit beta'
MSEMLDFVGLKIKLASPEVIRGWSYGEVVKPETINYRTLKAEKDGLFSESIFGPTKDWECYCGKYKRIRYKGIICDKCGVEVTHSRVRRERMGHIGLVAPVAHIWFFKGISSKLSMLLDIPPKSLESVIYFSQYLVTDVDEDAKKEILKTMADALVTQKTEIKSKVEQDIKKVETDAKGEAKGQAEKIKNTERRALFAEEQQLKLKQKIQSLRDEGVLEGERAEEIHRRISETVRKLKNRDLLTEEEYLSLLQHKATGFFKVGMGAEVILGELKKVDLEALSAKLRQEAKESKGARYLKATKRLRLIESLRLSGVDPAWMVIRILPVIPPDLRPMVQLVGGRFATSDLNDLYRRVINRNNRLKHLLELGAPEIILRNEKRMLQEAVDSLIDGSKRPTRRFRRRVQPLRSLSDMLRGKQGRFRQNLLGKRVDYSGRSVIVVGPNLKLRQCGLPKEMALEMFKPFVLREMIARGIAPNVKSAKNIFEHRPPEIFDILEEITKDHPVMLNRAPTLHKLGFQSFFPVLIEGNAIRIHPCVCSGYNADFDGDQMAVHVPLGTKAREECATNMLAEKNLLKPADGAPVTIPGKEMALGCYFVSSTDTDLPVHTSTFSSPMEAIFAFQIGTIKLRQLAKVRMPDGVTIETTTGRLLFNEIVPEELGFVNEGVKEPMLKSLVTKALRVCSRDKVVVFIDDLKEIGFWGVTLSGLSVGVWDCEIYPGKQKVIDRANDQVAEVEKNFAQGLITSAEKRRLTQQIWIDTTEELARLTWEKFSSGNSIRLMVEAGLRRASKEQVKQLSAMQGLVVDPLGKIVELPNKSNFREGLSEFEYVTSARGARKGLTDTALKTSDAGYLTRRLVDVAHDVIVRSEDCGTKEGLLINRTGSRKEKFLARILGRIMAKNVIDPKTKKTIIKAGEWVDDGNLPLLDKHGINEVWVRSPLTCEARFGICASCYGWDFSTKKIIEVGSPVGVLAAQSIGEPGTQLTMRTKHFGGILVSDVTQGLPRVEELFEIRMPKVLAPLAEIAGKVTVKETEEGGFKVIVRSVGIKPAEEREYFVPPMIKLNVENGQLVDAGTQLAVGALDVREVLEVRGVRAAQEYLIEEIQAVYESQGIAINDRHFESIVRKMSDKVQIETAGDTHFLPGELISKARFTEENEKVIAEGGEPSTAQVTMLGVTRASLYTESWLSAASYQETTNVLTEAAIEGKEDWLVGLKENVIIGRLIPVLPERAKIVE